MKIKLNQEVIDWMEATQSIYLNDTGEKTYLVFSVFEKINGTANSLNIIELKNLPLFVKEKICEMIEVEIVKPKTK